MDVIPMHVCVCVCVCVPMFISSLHLLPCGADVLISYFHPNTEEVQAYLTPQHGHCHTHKGSIQSICFIKPKINIEKAIKATGVKIVWGKNVEIWLILAHSAKGGDASFSVKPICGTSFDFWTALGTTCLFTAVQSSPHYECTGCWIIHKTKDTHQWMQCPLAPEGGTMIGSRFGVVFQEILAVYFWGNEPETPFLSTTGKKDVARFLLSDLLCCAVATRQWLAKTNNFPTLVRWAHACLNSSARRMRHNASNSAAPVSLSHGITLGALRRTFIYFRRPPRRPPEHAVVIYLSCLSLCRVTVAMPFVLGRGACEVSQLSLRPVNTKPFAPVRPQATGWRNKHSQVHCYALLKKIHTREEKMWGSRNCGDFSKSY